MKKKIVYLVEQIEPSMVATNHYRVVFNPNQVLPDIRVGS